MKKLSFQTKVIALTSVLITVVCIASILIFISFYSSSERIKLQHDLDALLDFNAEAVAKPLWGLDRDEIEKLLRVMNGNDRIAYVGVWTSWGSEAELFAEQGDPSLKDYSIVGERDIFEPGSEELIGRLKLVLSGDRVRFANETIWRIGFAMGFIIIVVSIGVILLGFHLFTRPLRILSLTMQRLSRNETDIDIPSLDRADEIGGMARSIDKFKMNAIKIKTMTGELQDHAKRLEASLEQQKELNALQRQFVSMVSHEFRTPLAIIDSVATRLEKEVHNHNPEDLMSRIETVRGAVVRMIQLIDSTLSASLLDEGKVACEPELCDIAALVKEAQETLANAKATHRYEIDLDGLPRWILGDPKLLHQVFSNLVSNAMKYSPDGSTIAIEGWTDDASVFVSVRDQGVGIPENEITNLFQRFFRASTSAGIAGTGIGLYVVKRFVEMHDGSIAVESSEGDGTCFTIRLPIGDADTSASEDTDFLGELVDIDERLFSDA